MDVYQLIGGRWQAISEKPERSRWSILGWMDLFWIVGLVCIIAIACKNLFWGGKL